MAISDYAEDRALIWDTFKSHERAISRLDERQTALDERQTAQALNLMGQRSWLYLSVGLSVVTLVLLVVVFILVVQLATYFQVLR